MVYVQVSLFSFYSRNADDDNYDANMTFQINQEQREAFRFITLMEQDRKVKKNTGKIILLNCQNHYMLLVFCTCTKYSRQIAFLNRWTWGLDWVIIITWTMNYTGNENISHDDFYYCVYSSFGQNRHRPLNIFKAIKITCRLHNMCIPQYYYTRNKVIPPVHNNHVQKSLQVC